MNIEHKNILIIEDERNLSRTLAQALRLGSNGGYEVDVCDTGEQALVRLHEKKYDLVVSDL
ncbi:MAG: response regulator, partial [Anaerolineae bacterium]|nr:response regulator [Anaerolineae bacterium]